MAKFVKDDELKTILNANKNYIDSIDGLDKLEVSGGLKLDPKDGKYVLSTDLDTTLFKVITGTSLPSKPDDKDINKIHLLQLSSSETNNAYAEYIWVNIGSETSPNWKWEKLGEKSLSLDGYATNTNVGTTMVTNVTLGTRTATTAPLTIAKRNPSTGSTVTSTSASIPEATESLAGLLNATDKKKLNNVPDNTKSELSTINDTLDELDPVYMDVLIGLGKDYSIEILNDELEDSIENIYENLNRILYNPSLLTFKFVVVQSELEEDENGDSLFGFASTLCPIAAITETVTVSNETAKFYTSIGSKNLLITLTPKTIKAEFDNSLNGGNKQNSIVTIYGNIYSSPTGTTYNDITGAGSCYLALSKDEAEKLYNFISEDSADKVLKLKFNVSASKSPEVIVNVEGAANNQMTFRYQGCLCTISALSSKPTEDIRLTLTSSKISTSTPAAVGSTSTTSPYRLIGYSSASYQYYSSTAATSGGPYMTGAGELGAKDIKALNTMTVAGKNVLTEDDQSNWDSKSSEKGYIKNKPFEIISEGVEETIYIANETVTLVDGGLNEANGKHYSMGTIEGFNGDLEVGKTYSVNVNGTTYNNLSPITDKTTGENILILASPSTGIDLSNYVCQRWMIFKQWGQGFIVYYDWYPTDEDGLETKQIAVQVYHKESTLKVKKLDKIFLPDDYCPLRYKELKVQTDTGIEKITGIVAAFGEDLYSKNDTYSEPTILDNGAMALGNSTSSAGEFSLSMGGFTVADGDYSVAEGSATEALGFASHAEGTLTSAIGPQSHAEGFKTEANGTAAHSSGYFTQAHGTGSFATGIFNDGEGKLFSIGNGGSIGEGSGNTSEMHRHNAFEVTESGDIYISNTSGPGQFFEKPMIHLQSALSNIGSGNTSDSIITIFGSIYEDYEKTIPSNIDSTKIKYLYLDKTNAEALYDYVYQGNTNKLFNFVFRVSIETGSRTSVQVNNINLEGYPNIVSFIYNGYRVLTSDLPQTKPTSDILLTLTPSLIDNDRNIGVNTVVVSNSTPTLPTDKRICIVDLSNVTNYTVNIYYITKHLEIGQELHLIFKLKEQSQSGIKIMYPISGLYDIAGTYDGFCPTEMMTDITNQDGLYFYVYSYTELNIIRIEENLYLVSVPVVKPYVATIPPQVH